MFDTWDSNQTGDGEIVMQARQEGRRLDSSPHPTGAFSLVRMRIDVSLDANF